jgi:hypothetical protein
MTSFRRSDRLAKAPASAALHQKSPPVMWRRLMALSRSINVGLWITKLP